MFLFLVIDDEATTVYTAGAIVTVTVTLIRRDMSVLFGDESANNDDNADETENNQEKETQNVAKKPIWQKQNRRSKNTKNKKFSRKVTKTSSVNSNATKGAGENGSVVSNKAPAEKKEKDKERDSDSGSSDYDDRSDDEREVGNQGDKKVSTCMTINFWHFIIFQVILSTRYYSQQDSSLEDDDLEWERLQTKISKRDKVLEGKSKLSHTVHCPYFPQV